MPQWALPAKTLLLLFGSVMIVSCAKPVLDIPEPAEWQRAQAQTTLNYTSLTPPPAPSGPLSMKARIDRVLPNIRFATSSVCIQLNLESVRCSEATNAPVNFVYEEQEINAYADQNDEVGMFGGLVREMGTDEEIAAVLAHELAHVMFGHPQKKMKNTLVGGAIAGGLAALYAAATKTDMSAYGEDWMRVGMRAGSNAYSPKMEIEADRLAVYTLKEAGYSPLAMRDAIVRLHRAKPPWRKGQSTSAKVGFLQTHPSDDRRIAHILASIRDAKAGVSLRDHAKAHRPQPEMSEEDRQFWEARAPQHPKNRGFKNEGGLWIKDGPR